MVQEVLYYYLKNEETKKPFGCVAICENEDGTINRGISLCSTKDVFQKNCARGLAFKRLNEAIKNKSSNKFNEFFGEESNCPVEVTGFTADEFFKMKSAYKVKPTAKEYRMLHKPADI